MESPYPDVDQLRAVARRLLRSARAGDPDALARLPRSDRGPLLADAQFAVARSVGFSSWPALIQATADWDRGNQTVARTRVLLVWHPPRVSDGHYRQHGGLGLSDEGVRHAYQLASRLASDIRDGVGAVLSSRKPPSVQTAAIVADALGIAPSEPTCALCEGHPGEGEGLAIAEFAARYGVSNSMVPGAETWRDVIARTKTDLRSIAEQHRGETVICVTEGGVVKASLVALGGADPPTANATPIAQGSITEWSVLNEGDVRRVGIWQLDRLNDTSHLEHREATTTVS